MPKLTPGPIRLWLREHDWDYDRLAAECNTIPNRPDDNWSAGAVRNAVNGHDPVRPGRIERIAAVTKQHPTESFPAGLTYDELIVAAVVDKPDEKKEEDGPKEEPVAPPPRRREKTGPKRVDSTIAGAA